MTETVGPDRPGEDSGEQHPNAFTSSAVSSFNQYGEPATGNTESALETDVDANGHLATGLFVGVIAVLLVLIYALSMAA